MPIVTQQAQKIAVEAKWTLQGDDIKKLADKHLLAMSSNGSLAWSREGIKVRVHCLVSFTVSLCHLPQLQL